MVSFAECTGPAPGPAGPQDGLQGALCAHSQVLGLYPRDSGSASLQAQACLGTAAFPWLCPITQVSFPAPASSSGTVSHSHRWKTQLHQQLGSVLGLFPSFFVTSQRWKLLMIFCKRQQLKAKSRARWGEENPEAMGVEMCVFPLPCSWAFQEAMLEKQAVRSRVDLACLCSFMPRSPGGLW